MEKLSKATLFRKRKIVFSQTLEETEIFKESTPLNDQNEIEMDYESDYCDDHGTVDVGNDSMQDITEIENTNEIFAMINGKIQ